MGEVEEGKEGEANGMPLLVWEIVEKHIQQLRQTPLAGEMPKPDRK